MSELFNSAREALDRAMEKAAPAMESAKERASAAFEDVKEKAAEVVDDVKEKAAPVVEKVKDGVSDAVDAVKEGAERVGDLLNPDIPGPKVKNELFDELETQVKAQRDAAKAKAEEMQRRLHEMMDGKGES